MITKTTQNPKFKRLVRRLRQMLQSPQIDIETIAVGILERLWHAAAAGAIQGDIGRFDDDLIAEMVGWHGDPVQLIELLVETRWLDRCEVHRLVIHDWADHAPNHVKGNVRKARREFAVPVSLGGSQGGSQGCSLGGSQGRSQGGSPGMLPPNQTLPNQTRPDLTREESSTTSAVAEPPPVEKSKPDLTIAPEPVRPILAEWITHKAQNGQKYKPIGLAKLIKQVANACKTHGCDAVVAQFERAMAAGWKGWDHGLGGGGHATGKNHGSHFGQTGQRVTAGQWFTGDE